jgi:hypothetical protein
LKINCKLEDNLSPKFYFICGVINFNLRTHNSKFKDKFNLKVNIPSELVCFYNNLSGLNKQISSKSDKNNCKFNEITT